MNNKQKEKQAYCSFCGKEQLEVKKLIAGPNVYICDECIDTCHAIVEEEFRLRLREKSGKILEWLRSIPKKLNYYEKVEYYFWGSIITILVLQVVTVFVLLSR